MIHYDKMKNRNNKFSVKKSMIFNLVQFYFKCRYFCWYWQYVFFIYY